jgi:hypothetical protein
MTTARASASAASASGAGRAPENGRNAPRADHELLERPPRAAGLDPRAHGVVAGHQHVRVDAERAPQVVDRLGQPGALGQPPGAVQADRQVPVAQVEPDVVAERPQLVHRRERVAGQAPAALVDRVGQPERHEVGVGGDVGAVDLDVVSGVGDDHQLVAELVEQPAGQLGAAGSPRQQDYGCHGAVTL